MELMVTDKPKEEQDSMSKDAKKSLSWFIILLSFLCFSRIQGNNKELKIYLTKMMSIIVLLQSVPYGIDVGNYVVVGFNTFLFVLSYFV